MNLTKTSIGIGFSFCFQYWDIISGNTKQIEVYIDDFIAMTNNLHKHNIKHMSRAILHGIHSISPPPNITGHKRGDPISIKKLKQGDGYWSTTKEILGWKFDGQNYLVSRDDAIFYSHSLTLIQLFLHILLIFLCGLGYQNKWFFCFISYVFFYEDIFTLLCNW